MDLGQFKETVDHWHDKFGDYPEVVFRTENGECCIADDISITETACEVRKDQYGLPVYQETGGKTRQVVIR